MTTIYTSQPESVISALKAEGLTVVTSGVSPLTPSGDHIHRSSSTACLNPECRCGSTYRLGQSYVVVDASGSRAHAALVRQGVVPPRSRRDRKILAAHRDEHDYRDGSWGCPTCYDNGSNCPVHG